MRDAFDSLPRDLAAAHALILAERTARLESEERAAHVAADLIHAQATASSADALIARLSLEIEKLRRTLNGARSERKERLIDQLEMQLEDTEPTRPRTSWPRNARRPRPWSNPSNASDRRESRSRSTYRANAL